MNRRGFLSGLLVAAPAIILTPGLLMPVRAQPILTNQFLYQVNFYKKRLVGWRDESNQGALRQG